MRYLVIAAVLLFAVLSPTPAHDDAPPIDAKTAEVMKKLGATYKDAKSIQCQATIETTLKRGEDKPRKIDMRATFLAQRPNLFRLRSDNVKEKDAGLDVVCDGKSLFVFARGPKEYLEKKAPTKFSPIGVLLLDVGHDTTGMLFQNLLSEDPAGTLLDGITEGKHAGMVKVGGKECHHLQFMQEGNLWELWVAAEGEAFVLKMSSTQETLRGDQQHTVETYTNWKRNVETAKDAFKFTPPDGATKVERLSDRQPAPKDDDN